MRVDDTDLHALTERARIWKEDQVAADPDNPDLGMIVQAYVGGQPVMMTNPTGMDQAVESVRLLGQISDIIAMVSDAYGAVSPTKSDGSQWEGGELREVYLSGGPDRDLVTEAMLVEAHDRYGRVYASEQPYRIVGGDLLWEPVRETILDAAVYDGQLTNAMALIMKQDNLLDHPAFKPDLWGLNHDTAFAHVLSAIAKHLMDEGIQVAVGVASQQQREVIARSMGDDDIDVIDVDPPL